MRRATRSIVVLGLLLASQAMGQEKFDCLMDPYDTIDLGSPAAGVLAKVLVKRGDAVRIGEVVAELDSTLEQGNVELLELRAESDAVIEAQREQLDLINKRYERIAQLRQRGVASEEDFDQIESERIAVYSLLVQAELNRDIAIKELRRARAALRLRQIVSPVDGVVSERLLSPGEYIGSDSAVVRIVQLDPLSIQAFLPVRLWGRVAIGDVGTVYPAAPIEGEYRATVVSVDRVLDAASGTFVVQLELPNPDRALPAGHRCEISF